jgi:DUF4097 and DUF4098 domain-containing protein YvlB
VSGDLALAGGAIETLSARTVSGKIAADIDLGEGGRIEVNTVSGEVALRIPESAGTRVALTSAAGRIETTFPELGREERAVTRSVSGKLGDGSAKLTVNTVSGGVALLGRPEDGDTESTTPRMEK